MPTHVNYCPSESERRLIAAGHMVPLEQVPHQLTGGVRCASWDGVVFAERVGGQQVALHTPGRVRLMAALRCSEETKLARAA